MQIIKISVGKIRTNCYIVYDEEGDTFVVDPGADFEKINSALGKIPKLKLLYILLTHAHYDHVGALDELKKAYPSADIIISERDISLLRNVPAQGLFVGQILRSIKSPVLSISDGEVLNFGESRIRALATPGHSSGGLCYLLDSVLFSGDTIFYHTYGRVDLPDSNPKEMEKSLKKILALPREVYIYPGHGKTTSVGAERIFWGVRGDE